MTHVQRLHAIDAQVCAHAKRLRLWQGTWVFVLSVALAIFPIGLIGASIRAFQGEGLSAPEHIQVWTLAILVGVLVTPLVMRSPWGRFSSRYEAARYALQAMDTVPSQQGIPACILAILRRTGITPLPGEDTLTAVLSFDERDAQGKVLMTISIVHGPRLRAHISMHPEEHAELLLIARPNGSYGTTGGGGMYTLPDPKPSTHARLAWAARNQHTSNL